MNDSKKTTKKSRFSLKAQISLDNFRHRLAHLDALPQLTLLGLISGVLAALVIVLFRLAVEFPLNFFLEGGHENFEGLAVHWRFLLPIIGAIILIGITSLFKPEHRQISVGHVIERLNNHQGQLPIQNWLLQFFGGITTLLTGQSMGREGPAVHLGAGIASQLGQLMKLPNNSLRTLVGCGVASAIAASFNTPMAGVIFAMEVVLMEYTIAGFVPVMMASVTGAVVAQYIFSSEPIFAITSMQINTLNELPIIIIAGLVIALFASTIIRTQLWFNEKKHWPMTVRFLIAGTATGVIAIFLPQILGVGYDTIESAILGKIGFEILIAILFAKILATAISSGFGLPGGIIGPMLFIGGILGGILGFTANLFFPETSSSSSFYVLLGMAAMMAAVINAPLAALITVLELTYNPHIIFPTMLIIVIAVVATRQLFNCQGIFIAQLEANGFKATGGPVQQALIRVGVRSVMDINFKNCPTELSSTRIKTILSQHPKWLTLESNDKNKTLLAAADISAYLDTLEFEEEDVINLLEAPCRKWQMKPINEQSNLYEARKYLQEDKADALYVERQSSHFLSPVLGVITMDKIDSYYS
jgi:CIC family chloride channel protein